MLWMGSYPQVKAIKRLKRESNCDLQRASADSLRWAPPRIARGESTGVVDLEAPVGPSDEKVKVVAQSKTHSERGLPKQRSVWTP